MGRTKNRGNPDWKGDLQRLIRKHNEMHAKRGKTVAYNTQGARAASLFRVFTLLRQAGFKAGPASLGSRHIEFLMRYWTADPRVGDELRVRNSTLAPRKEAYSPAYIQQQLSFLRTLANWVGKPGLVLPAVRYVDNAALVTRHGNATRDRSWSGAQVDLDAVLELVRKHDAVVGLQLEVLVAFGLRRKEAVMFSPALAEVPAHALPAGASPGSYAAFLRVKRGTKGGRVRYTAIRTERQRDVLLRALLAAPRPGMYIGRPGLSLKQALKRFSNVMEHCGVTLRGLGVTAHGVRHEFAADLFFEIAEVPAPIKGGPIAIDAEVMHEAYLEVARQLGHARARITNAYLGSPSAPASGATTAANVAATNADPPAQQVPGGVELPGRP